MLLQSHSKAAYAREQIDECKLRLFHFRLISIIS